jgi:hypothetical protein
MTRKVFINRRRKNSERREEDDPCKDMSIDIYHRKRRKAVERRKPRTLDEDYYAFLASVQNENDELGDGRHH